VTCNCNLTSLILTSKEKSKMSENIGMSPSVRRGLAIPKNLSTFYIFSGNGHLPINFSA
jgi:hypothetical protein